MAVTPRAEARHSRPAEGLPGLYFAGLQFLYAQSSSMVHGVGRDARRVAEAIAADLRGGPA